MTSGARTALLITPAFFGYESEIAAELRRQGYDTTFVDERPSNSSIVRAVARVRRSVLGRRIGRYYAAWAERLRDRRFDVIVVIKAEVVPRWFLESLRSWNPRAIFVFYTFDALRNAPNCLDILDLFDRRLTFDRVDASENPEFGYLPLFYSPEFRPAVSDGKARDYLISSIGTLHSDRYAFVTACLSGLDDAFAFFYVQARWYFAFLKYVSREFSSVKWGEISFRPLSKAEVAHVFRNSSAVLDMQRDGQHGLTMRTFEVLASGTILVTTNAEVAKEPFYDPARILIVPPRPSSEELARLRDGLREMSPPSGPPAGFDEYSLSEWVRRLVGDNEVRPSTESPLGEV